MPVISAGLNSIAKLGPFGAKTAVGGETAIARLHIHQDTSLGNTTTPTLVFPDNTNPRYSTGFASTNVSNVGQRLDIYAGDSGNNQTNLDSGDIVMSVRADKRVGINTISPKENMLVVFPAWVPHAVEINLSDEERISLSFNFKLNRTFSRVK